MHWSWLIVAAFQIERRTDAYSSLGWNIAEYLVLFLIVLLHEFGHAFACRQVGGRAEHILLWPLGGVAYISPPQRPGALLWSIVAGPLVNVLLIVPLGALWYFADVLDWAETMPDLEQFVTMVALINVVLLVFNLLPIYPLDGGQILRAGLWFFIGRSRSLFVAAVIGGLGAAGLVAYAVKSRSIWMGVVAVFVFLRCRTAWQQAKSLATLERGDRRAEFSCPSCHASPPRGSFWRCPRCRATLDTFETRAVCPQCAAQFPTTPCLDCGGVAAFAEWEQTPALSGTGESAQRVDGAP
jgi:Zn-dependent protease